MYGSYIDTTTGKVTDPTGRSYDAVSVHNTPDAQRWYDGVTAAATYRATPQITVGGNYTLSYGKGNNDGENVGSGPVMASINEFPEYKQQAWNWPTGYMMNDQRHKARLYANWVLPVNPSVGGFTIGAIERINTGTPYDIGFGVANQAYVTNPGYLAPPSNVTYYIDGRGPRRMETMYATDLSFVWTKKLRGSLELFFRGLVYNVFNGQTVMSVDTTVNSAVSPGSYPASAFTTFNPFTTQPVKDVHYKYGPIFGQPTQPSDYQISRTFECSFGIRF
jgi:hypothetical protein